MSTYNETKEELFLSINSILNQTYKNIEFIIVNDNPERDDLRKILTSFDDERIVVIENKENKGLVYSLNNALNASKGKYIVRMDADDVSVNNRIEKELKYLLNNNLDLVGSWCICIDENGKEIEKIKKISTNNNIVKNLKYECTFAHPTWICKKSLYEKLNGYRNITACEDHDFVLRARKMGCKFGNIPEYLLMYRVRKNGVSSLSSEIQYLTAHYLSKNCNRINSITQEEINRKALNENEKKKYIEFCLLEHKIKETKFSMFDIFNILINKYTYIKMINSIRRKIYIFIETIRKS